MLPKIDERDRVEAFLAHRDESSFRALYREHTPVLYRLAFRFLGAAARGDVEDVVQETWIRAVRRLPTFEWRSSLRTWLVGILVNCARETTRRRRTLPDGGNHRTCSAPDTAIDLDDAITRLASDRAEKLVHFSKALICGREPKRRGCTTNYGEAAP